jgi:hypothetical protein
MLMVALFVGACGGEVKPAPLRQGEVVSTHDIGAVTFILARDDEDRNFWVMTNICTIGTGGKIEVLRGTHYSRIRSEDLGRTLNDVYSAQLILINGREVKGFGGEGLPANCVDLR